MKSMLSFLIPFDSCDDKYNFYGWQYCETNIIFFHAHQFVVFHCVDINCWLCTFDGIELLLKLANSNVHNFENAKNSKWELFDLIIYSRYLPEIF